MYSYILQASLLYETASLGWPHRIQICTTQTVWFGLKCPSLEVREIELEALPSEQAQASHFAGKVTIWQHNEIRQNSSAVGIRPSTSGLSGGVLPSHIDFRWHTYSRNKDNPQFNIRHAEGAADVSTRKLDKVRLRRCRVRYFGQPSYLQFRNQALARPGHVNKHMYVRKSTHQRYVFTDAENPSTYCRNTPHQTSNWITAWRTVCSETLTLVPLIKKFLTCHGLWRFVAVSTTACQWHYDDLHESNPHNKSCSILIQFFDICLGFGLSLPVCV